MSSAPPEIVPPPTKAGLRVFTLGGFRVCRDDRELDASDWSREKAVQLFQFLVTVRRKRHLHKEVIIDRLWPELDLERGDRDFKVALNAINQALEPDRPPRSTPRFVERSGLTYGLRLDAIWIDADAFERYVRAGNEMLRHNPEQAIERFRSAVALYTGDYLPERRYEDWSSQERERLQTLALSTMTTMADLLLERNPHESLRLAQHVLTIDPVWENAYRTVMRAHMATGNRPLALRAYQQCVSALADAFDVEPLPETRDLYEAIASQ